MTGDDQAELGVLETSGTFRSFGQMKGDGVSLSPTAARLPSSGSRARCELRDRRCRRGRQVASTPIKNKNPP
jgi:hypothetical protein